MTAAQPLHVMAALGAVADELVRGHDEAPGPMPDLAPGLSSGARGDVFAYLGLELPESYGSDTAGHNLLGEGSHALTVLAGLSDVVDAAWSGNDEDLYASLVLMAADAVRWLQQVDDRLGPPATGTGAAA